MNESNHEKSIAFVFPGQGSQRIGMVSDLFNAFSECREVFERASGAIGEDVASLCFNQNDLLDLTEYTQPAILTAEIAIVNVLEKQFGFKAEYFGGHSLGEYTALVAAGVLQLEDALKIVRERGSRMQSAVEKGRGAMAALIYENISSINISELLEEGCQVANFNSNDQIVLSGEASAVESSTKLLSAKFPDMRIVPLNVSAPFHSFMMKPIEASFETFLRTYESTMETKHSSKVLSNFTGDFHTPNSLISSLVTQISSPVRWLENMSTLAKLQIPIYEIGPLRVLGKFFSSLELSVPTMSDLRSLNKIVEGRSHAA